ncbi:unnamed protein product [Cylindrotheca closterium]|uniref:Uncharacterized protein n=1 Tax=Cylindrotheca closterium TaxID=2856 RepID=A0AAD2PWS9_9STRA|nr:unnamed protein product [Cylindrotheca closterium]
MVVPYCENDSREINNRPLTLSSLESTNLLSSMAMGHNQADVFDIDFKLPVSSESRTEMGRTSDFESRLESIRGLREKSEADFETSSSCCSAVQTLQKQEQALETLLDSFQETSPKSIEVDDNDIDEEFSSLKDSLRLLQDELSAVDMIIPQLGSGSSGMENEDRMSVGNEQARISSPLHESPADDNYLDSVDVIRSAVPFESPSFDENHLDILEGRAGCPTSCTSGKVSLESFFWGVEKDSTAGSGANEELPPLSPCSSYLECNPSYPSSFPNRRTLQPSNENEGKSLLTKATGHSTGLQRPYVATGTNTKATSPIKNASMRFNDRTQLAYTSTVATKIDSHQDLMSTANRCSSKLQETLELKKQLNQSSTKGIRSYPATSAKMTRVKFGPAHAVSTLSGPLLPSRQHLRSFDKLEDQQQQDDARENNARGLTFFSTANQQATNPFDSFDSNSEDGEEDPGTGYRPPSTSHMTVDSSVAPSGDRYLPNTKVQTPKNPSPRFKKAIKTNMNEELTQLGVQVNAMENLNEDDPNRPLHSMLNRGQLNFDFEFETGNGDVPNSMTSLELNPLEGKERDTYRHSTTKLTRHPGKTSLNGFEQNISSQVLLGPSNHREAQSSRPSLSVPSQNEEVILEETDDNDEKSFSVSILDNIENCIELVCGDVTHHSPLSCIREPLKTGAHKPSMKRALATGKNEDGHSGFAFGEDGNGVISSKGSRYRKAMGKMLLPKKETTERKTVSRSKETSFNFKSFETDVQSFSISGSWDNQETGKSKTAGDSEKSSGTTLLSTIRVQEEVIQRNCLLLDALVAANHASYRVLTSVDLLGVDTFGRMVQGNSIVDCYPKGTILRKATMTSPIVRCLGKGMATITYLRIDEVRNGVETNSKKLMETRMWKKERQAWVNCQFHQTIVSSNYGE